MTSTICDIDKVSTNILNDEFDIDLLTDRLTDSAKDKVARLLSVKKSMNVYVCEKEDCDINCKIIGHGKNDESSICVGII